MNSLNKQAGVSLVEAMIGIALSMIVVTSMVGLMSNSMGTATRIIEMTQLTDELRNATSMMTRDVRRANYSADALFCYGNPTCAAMQVADINVPSNGCFTFNLDRDQQGSSTVDDTGGFRLASPNGVGRIEMWVGGASPDCSAGTGGDWLPVTDDAMVEVTEFTVDETTSFDDSIVGEGGSIVTQRVRHLKFSLEGELLIDDSITRRIEDSIRVRNDFLAYTPAP